MPFVKLPDGTVCHVKMSGRRKKALQCVAQTGAPGQRTRCTNASGYLCDWPVAGTTCSAPLCAAHAHQVAEDTHYCACHHARSVQALQRKLFTNLGIEP